MWEPPACEGPLGASVSLWELLGASVQNITESKLHAHLPATGEACGDLRGSLRGILGLRCRLSEHEAIAQRAAVNTEFGGRHKCVCEPPASGSLWEPLGAFGSLWEPLYTILESLTEYYRIQVTGPALELEF